MRRCVAAIAGLDELTIPRHRGKTLMETEAYAASGIERKKIETLFGEAKHILALAKLRLRGLSGARDEFLLTATVQNLKRLARNPETVAEIVFDAFTEDEYGVLDEVL